MWILCCGMKRSGSTLHYQLAAHLVESAGRGQRVGWTETFADAFDAYNQAPGWKVYKNHNFSPDLAALLAGGQAKGLYVYRDLRDVFVSFMLKQDAPFERLWQRDILREPVEQFALWTAQPGMLVTRYETMMHDVPAEVLRIAAHLQLPLTSAQAAAIAHDYSIDRQKQRIESSRDPVKANGKAAFDKHSLLHENHISETHGQIGQWRAYLTPHQAGQIEARYGSWLASHGYTLSEATES